jgi:hypothetical protein
MRNIFDLLDTEVVLRIYISSVKENLNHLDNIREYTRPPEDITWGQ